MKRRTWRTLIKSCCVFEMINKISKTNQTSKHCLKPIISVKNDSFDGFSQLGRKRSFHVVKQILN